MIRSVIVVASIVSCSEAWASDMPEDEKELYWGAGACGYAYFHAGKADYAEQVRARVKAAAVSKESAEDTWGVAEIYWTSYGVLSVMLNPMGSANSDIYDDARRFVVEQDCHKYLPD